MTVNIYLIGLGPGREDKVLSKEHVIFSIPFVVPNQDKLWGIWLSEEYLRNLKQNKTKQSKTLQYQDVIDLTPQQRPIFGVWFRKNDMFFAQDFVFPTWS